MSLHAHEASYAAAVGSVAPHLLRFIAGPDHRLTLPCSPTCIVLLADLAARVVILPSELPGVPSFPFLLSHRHEARA